MNLDKKSEKNILFQLLKTFTSEEWEGFEKFVDSPFYNKGRNYGQIMKILKKHYPDFDSKELSKENFYNKLFPGNEYKENVIYSMFSRLYSIAEEFLMINEMSKDNYISKEKYKLAMYRVKGMNAKADKLISDMQNVFDNKKKSIYDYYRQKEFQKELAYYYYANNRRDKISAPVINLLKYSIYYQLIEYFTFEISLLTQKGFSQSDFNENYVLKFIECTDMDKFFKMLKQNDKENYPVIRLHYLSSMIIKNPLNSDYYDEMKQLTFDNLDTMDIYLKKYMLNSLAMHCSNRYVGGQEKYLKEGFEIRKKTVEENLFSFNDTSSISNSEFRSTFIEALNVNEIDWAEEFAEKYLKYIKPEFREMLGFYTRARIAYERGNYSEAVNYAGKVNINQITFKLDMKNLLSKIYYDTNSTEPLISLLNSYYKLIKNSESRNDEILKRHTNFVKFLKDLLKIRLDNKKESDLKLLQTKLNRENVTAKKWLNKKIEDLKP